MWKNSCASSGREARGFRPRSALRIPIVTDARCSNASPAPSSTSRYRSEAGAESNTSSIASASDRTSSTKDAVSNGLASGRGQ